MILTPCLLILTGIFAAYNETAATIVCGILSLASVYGFVTEATR